MLYGSRGKHRINRIKHLSGAGTSYVREALRKENLSTDATRGGIKHVIHRGVLNPYGLAIAEKAVMSMGNANGRLENFPGHKFTPSGDRKTQAAFEALVG
ncbi:hypothetical protein LTR95_006848 [Oleoguttula sp. CCFEE 5521]